jgi:cysteine desulfurase / selenocysteine lyase
MSRLNDLPLQMAFELTHLREDFPILGQIVRGKPLVYFDNAATTQKPKSVIEAIAHFYEADNSNVHRGVHTLSQRATEAYEAARARVARFLHAARPEEIVFVRGTTEAINLAAQAYARPRLEPGDEVLLTHMEHHSNIVPWQLACEVTGANLKVAPINDAGELILEEYEKLLTPRTKLVAVTHVSNALGTVNPLPEIIRLAHGVGAKVLVDGAQAAAHVRIDVRHFDCDFYAFSGHKVYGPTGIGVLYGKYALLAAMPPYQGGGEMIRTVSFERTTYAEPPARFEAGTPHISGAIGLAAALDYLEGVGVEAVADHESALLRYATERARELPGLRIIGEAGQKAGILSFTLEGAHPHDIGTILDVEGVAIRAGHHCAMPLMKRFGIPATARASFALYNTREEVDRLIGALTKVRGMFP